MPLAMSIVACILCCGYGFYNYLTGEGRLTTFGPLLVGAALYTGIVVIDGILAVFILLVIAIVIFTILGIVLSNRVNFIAIIKDVDTENRVQRPMATRRPVLTVREEIDSYTVEIALSWQKYRELRKKYRDLVGRRVLITTWKGVLKKQGENPPLAHQIHIIR